MQTPLCVWSPGKGRVGRRRTGLSGAQGKESTVDKVHRFFSGRARGTFLALYSKILLPWSEGQITPPCCIPAVSPVLGPVVAFAKRSFPTTAPRMGKDFSNSTAPPCMSEKEVRLSHVSKMTVIMTPPVPRAATLPSNGLSAANDPHEGGFQVGALVR